ncbi:MAG TPA: heavy metal translocating P-type ATPase [Hyphomicrobiaceae bacterium]
MEKSRFDLELLLPEVPDDRDACIGRLRDALEARAGIEAAHLLRHEEAPQQRLCIHFNPSIVSLQDVRRMALQAGTDLQQRYGHLLASIPPRPARRARRLAAEFARLPGVLEAAVAADGTVRIEFDRQLADEAAIRAFLETHDRAREDHEGHAHGGRAELVFVGLCGLTLLTGWMLERFSGIDSRVGLAFLLAAYFFGGFFTLREAFASVRAGRFEIDSLMLVAAAGAAALGEWAEGALLLFLFSLGHALERYAMGRARRAIEALADLAPQTAIVRRDGVVAEVAVADLRIGDTVLVKPNERLPADGLVERGESSVNQAPITGESVPVDKRTGDTAFAGTINGAGALEIRVTRAAADSTLSRVVKMVREAQTNQSPTQQFTDRFERIFVPAVLGGASLLLASWLVVDEPFSASFYRAMAVLVAASPCALAIATPSAVLSGIARAAGGGVLVKGGGPLENLGRLTAVAFDKTGTLTEGKPRLTDVVAGPGAGEQELLRVAFAVESQSDHPLAAAVVGGVLDRLGQSPADEATELRSITGRGVQAKVGGQVTHVGKDVLFSEIGGPPPPDALRGAIEELKRNGRTTMVVRQGERYLGVLGLMDTPRVTAKAVVARLHSLGIRRTIMISGDNQSVADAVAQSIGIDDPRGDLMPEHKVEAIRQLRKEGGVAMIGDGVNDAPAMANATVGIAMGAAGSDVALETADVALMADDLERLPFAIGLSRSASRIIRQNVWVSLGIVAFLVPATIFGLGIGPAVLVHEGSTVLVVFNALRLLAYSEPL